MYLYPRTKSIGAPHVVENDQVMIPLTEIRFIGNHQLPYP